MGRDEDLQAVHEFLQQAAPVVLCALKGMGGIGKTELALQYASAHTADYPGGVGWLNARENLELQLTPLDLEPAPSDWTQEQRIRRCWSYWGQGVKLLIFDDVQDDESVQPFIPPSGLGFKVLMTSRRRLLGSCYEVQVLSEEAALKLLRYLTDQERIDRELGTAKEICNWLGYLPLGLELVGRYLAWQPDLSLVDLWESLQAERLAAEAMLEAVPGMTAKVGVVAAFSLSWKQLSKNAQTLAMLLSVFALAEIPWRLVVDCWEGDDSTRLRDRELQQLSLLSRVRQEVYELHSLLREFFAVKLAQYPERESLITRFAEALTAEAKTVEQIVVIEEQERLKLSIPHLREAVQYHEYLSVDDKTWCCTASARFHESCSLFKKAEELYMQSLEIRENQSGAEHPDTATSLNNLATFYYSMGRYGEAEPLYLRSSKIREKYLGAEHPDTSASLNNLAGLYKFMGRYGEAEPLLLRSLEIREKQLGEKHPDTSISLNSLAELYKSMGCYGAAEPLYLRSLNIREKQLGGEHPDTAESLNNLATFFCATGRYGEAEPLYLRSSKIREEQLGEEHPDTADSLNNLALLYRSVRSYGKAEPLYLRSLKIREKQLGGEHPDIATSLNNLAELYHAAGWYGEAEPLYLRSLEILEKQLGAAHPNTVTCSKNLAGLREAMGRSNSPVKRLLNWIVDFVSTIFKR